VIGQLVKRKRKDARNQQECQRALQPRRHVPVRLARTVAERAGELIETIAPF
jgi:hypothetical protein